MRMSRKTAEELGAQLAHTLHHAPDINHRAGVVAAMYSLADAIYAGTRDYRLYEAFRVGFQDQLDSLEPRNAEGAV